MRCAICMYVNAVLTLVSRFELRKTCFTVAVSACQGVCNEVIGSCALECSSVSGAEGNSAHRQLHGSDLVAAKKYVVETCNELEAHAPLSHVSASQEALRPPLLWHVRASHTGSTALLVVATVMGTNGHQ